MRRVAFISALVLMWAASPALGQSTVQTEVDTTVIHVGDPITMTLTVDHPAGTRARLPDAVSVEPFEVLAAVARPAGSEGERARSVFEVTVTAFELGELELPSMPVEVVGPDGSIETARTDRYGIEVVSVGADESGDIREIRGPLGIPVSSWVLALWVLGPLVLAVLLYYLARRLRPRGAEVVRPALGPPPRPAHEVALEALAELEASPLLERGRVKEYHIAASDILRTYVEERFRVDALEMTTREVLDGLGAEGVDASFRLGLRTFLESCDLVKFAMVRPGARESHSALELGRRIILETVSPVPAEPTPTEPAPAESRLSGIELPAEGRLDAEASAGPVSEEG